MSSAVEGAVFWLMWTAGATAAQTQVPPSEAGEAKEVTAEGVVIRYRAIPWDPLRLAAVATARPGPVAALPLGQLQLKVPMRLDGGRLEAGHYHILCHTPPAVGTDPVLGLVRFSGPALPDSAELADLGRVDLVSRPPIRFNLAAGTTPALRIRLAPTKGGVTLTVEYGNRRAVAVLRR